MIHDVEMPRRLKARPTYKGMPVPFIVAVIEGVPDFRIHDDEKWLQIAKMRLCQLCGQKLGRHLYFIGGPSTYENRLFYDPPMHEDCARFALQVCPYLGRTDWEYSSRALPEGGYKTEVVNLVDRKRPDRIGLMHGKEYEIVRVRVQGEGKAEGLFLKAAPFLSVEWFE